MGQSISMILPAPALSGYQKTDNALPSALGPSTPTGPITPTSRIVHKVDLSSCQCYTAGMDPLVTAGFHNLTCSPLCRLPEELLLDIMERLSNDLVSIQCLRQVSRLFLRLYSSPTFSSSHRSQDCTAKYMDSVGHWYEPKNDLLNKTKSQKLQILLSKDITNYCQDCQQKRIDQSWSKKNTALTMKYLHCSGCHIDHTVCLFSKTQRSKSPKTRVCIGRERYVRVCEHLILTWKDVISTALNLSILNTKLATVFIKKCEHESHFPKLHRKDSSLMHYQLIYPAIELRECRN
jgi:Pyruvate/2-oxoacid:ferredoxin oxidoreductase delta subunit